MSGWEQNDAEDSLHGADLDEAARRLADVLDEEDADVLVGYDWHGGYGHPDHVKVHHLVHRAAELAARRPRLLESTMNRTLMLRPDRGRARPGQPTSPTSTRTRRWTTATRSARPRTRSPGGSTSAAYLDQRRASLEAHRSQATDIEGFLSMPPEVFAAVFGHEHYIEPGVDEPMRRRAGRLLSRRA